MNRVEVRHFSSCATFTQNGSEFCTQVDTGECNVHFDPSDPGWVSFEGEDFSLSINKTANQLIHKTVRGSYRVLTVLNDSVSKQFICKDVGKEASYDVDLGFFTTRVSDGILNVMYEYVDQFGSYLFDFAVEAV